MKTQRKVCVSSQKHCRKTVADKKDSPNIMQQTCMSKELLLLGHKRKMQLGCAFYLLISQIIFTRAHVL